MTAGVVQAAGTGFELQVSGSDERLKLEPPSGPAPSQFAGKTVEVVGSVPEVAKGKNVDVIRYTSIKEK